MTNRLKLFLLWFAGFAVCFCELLLLVIEKQMFLANLTPNATVLVGIFAPYLTAIVAFWFAAPQKDGDLPEEKRPFQVAFVCSCFFNFAIFAVITSIFFLKAEQDQVEETMKAASKIATLLAFLVGPAIGFFFGKAKKR